MFLLLFGLILFIEGVGIQNGRSFIFYFILILPFVIFARSIVDKKKILIPKVPLLLMLLFLLFSGISVIFSANLQKSFEYFCYYITCFLLFTYAYNHKKYLKEKLTQFIAFFTVIFVSYSLFITFLVTQASYIIPDRGYQFVFSRFGSHNHLGDFLLLPLSLLFLYFITTKQNLKLIIPILLLLPFFVLSYSRSAYLDLLIVIVFLCIYYREKIKEKLSLILFPSLIVPALLILFFSTVIDIKYPPLAATQSFLAEHANLNGKEFTGEREHHIGVALKAITENPLLGVGPGNFYIASEKFTSTKNTKTETAHSIFFEIMTENGLLAGLIFVMFILLYFIKAKFSVPTLLAFIMLLNFQTDYTYRILSFLVLFFVLIGISYEGKREINITKLSIFSSLLLFIISLFIFMSNVFSYSNPTLSLTFYPLNEQARIILIEENISNGNKQEALSQIELYSSYFNDLNSLKFIGDSYLSLGYNNKALEYYNKAYNYKLY